MQSKVDVPNLFEHLSALCIRIDGCLRTVRLRDSQSAVCPMLERLLTVDVYLVFSHEVSQACEALARGDLLHL